MADRYETRLQPIEIGEYIPTGGGKEAKPITIRGVFAQVLWCILAGIGAAILIAAILYWLRAPDEWLLLSPLLLGLIVTGALLLIRAIPWEWIFTVKNAVKTHRTIATAQARENEAYKHIRRLVMEHEIELQRMRDENAAQVAGLQRSLDRALLERDTAKLELERFRNMAKPGRQTFVARERAQSQEEQDARRILDRWFNALSDSDRWTPRRDAPTVLGYSEGRHIKAVAYLERAGIVVGQRVVVKPLDAALQQLSDYAIESSKAPIDAPPMNWEDADSM
jgi:hypothetical protein